MPRGNHDTGKIGESETWEFLLGKGYSRPIKEERIRIAKYYKEKNIIIEKSGFDVILTADRENIGKTDICLFEVKTTGTQRGKKIGQGFVGLGFTLTEKELSNAKALENKFVFLFVNLASRTFTPCNLQDFFNKDKSRIYQTWSVFLKEKIDLEPK